ncbi:MAG TPA: hypothetical protein VMT50_10310 [Steroidobacteraceae bacterium]|nr:hypothetical protein [Steroidobacteraceae bacterium]
MTSSPCPARFRVVLIAGLGLLAACSPRPTPEVQVRAVLASGERAAEARNLSAVMALVSSRYEDAAGGSAVELGRYLRGYFMANPSLHLAIRVESIEFPYRDMARARVTLGTLGRDAARGAGLEVAAGLYDVRVDLQLERGEWKVTRAEWHPVAPG